MIKKTKIVSTIGPSSETQAMIEKMVKAGMNVARLNFSHGTYQHHEMLINNIRSVAKKLNVHIGIIQDLQGPRIRIGSVGQGLEVAKGKHLILAPENYKVAKNEKALYVPMQYPNLYKDVKPNQAILIDDAAIRLKIEKVVGQAIYCKVVVGGKIGSHKGMNFPDSDIRCPATTAKDLKDLEFGILNDVDFIALSFVRDDKDVIRLKQRIMKLEKKYNKKKDLKKQVANRQVIADVRTHVIAKIERREAINNFDKILKVADSIMIARGDLGIELPFEDLPLLQKNIISKCRRAGKPVIVATQMLDSMIRNPIPTRAEVSDVANAILDGTDAIMLSGETASGKYPLKAIEAMTRIAGSVEGHEIKEQEKKEQEFKNVNSMTQVMGFIAQDLSEDVSKAKLIVCATASGATARHISSFRTNDPVVAISPSQKTANQLTLSWGVESYVLSLDVNFDEFLEKIKALIKEHRLIKRGEKFIVAAGHPFNQRIPTNLIKLEEI